MHVLRILRTLSAVLLLGNALAAQNAWMYDAACYNADKERYYFFFGPNYAVKEVGKPIDGLIRPIDRAFKGFSKLRWESEGPIDAVVYNDDSEIYYFFKGREYARKPAGKPFDSGYPRRFDAANSGFKNMPFARLDAAVFKRDSKTYYFFADGQYARKKSGEPVEPPLALQASGSGFKLPEGEQILGAVYKKQDEKYYFFYGNGYRRKPKGKNPTGLLRYKGQGFSWGQRPSDGWVKLAHDGGYVGRFTVKWKALSGGGKYGPSAVGGAGFWSRKIILPKDLTSLTVTAEAWVPAFNEDLGKWVEITKQSRTSPPNQTLKVWGIFSDPKWSWGSGGAFWVDEVPNELEAAANAVVSWIEEQANAVVTSRAMEALQAHEDTIRSAVGVVTRLSENSGDYTNLAGQLGQALIGSRSSQMEAGRALQGILDDPQLLNLARNSGFQTVSCSVGISGQKYIGAQGALGGAMSVNNPNQYCLVGGAGGRIASDVGAEGGVEFGFWRVSPTGLSGPSVAVGGSVSVGQDRTNSVGVNLIVDLRDPLNPKFAGFTITAARGVAAQSGPSGALSFNWTFVYHKSRLYY